jgi:hypothetical protein
MASSGLCGRRNCVTRVGSSGEVVELEIPEALDLGEFNTSNISTLISTYQNNVVSSPGDNDPITTIVREYGETPFYTSVAVINQYLAREEVRDLINAERHPILKERIDTGIILTPIEVAQFTIEFGYTPLTLSTSAVVVSTKIPNELEAFYTKNFTQGAIGGFCALLPSVFAGIGLFFTALDGITDLVNKLKNFSLNFSLKALLNQLKSGITKVIDRVIEKVKGIVENFSIENVVSEVKTFLTERIGSQFQKIKETALKFFDPENIKNFKNKIEALIDYAVGVFKNPTLEDIQFLLFRFCQFASQIENGINAIKNPLEDFTNSYKNTVRVLQANSSGNTVRAVSAGAIRYELPARDSGINTAREIYTAAGDIPPLGPNEFSEITPWNEGRGDSRIKFVGRWPSVLGRDGWEMVDMRARAMLMMVQKEFGRQLNVNSGYRSPEYNASLNGSAKNSYHMQGMAMDISWSGINAETREEFVRIARSNGFRGIGRYGPSAGNFVHIDIGPERTWSKGI